ncbi:MAG: SAM-dependent methyltransferase [Mariprofundaceae bacterium]|nr:SAM-dependent methyltransferase [Mariprofundaceae bacterium]
MGLIISNHYIFQCNDTDGNRGHRPVKPSYLNDCFRPKADIQKLGYSSFLSTRITKFCFEGGSVRKDKPSMTARKVALSVVTLGVKPGMDRILPSGVAEATERLLIASGVVGPATIRWARSKRMLSIYENAFDWMMPGQLEAFAHRKSFCERQVRDGIREGATQVLVLGAGYDTMGWRLSPEYPDVTFYEIDHPATASLKSKGIDAMGQRDNLCLITEDLGKRKLADVLKSNKSWDESAPSVLIAEGLVMYLPPEAVQDMFFQCDEITGSGSRIAFSYIPTGTDGRPDIGWLTGILMWGQKAIGEPWTWSILPEELGSFLEKTGWMIAPSLPGTTHKYGIEFFIVATK